MTAKLNKSNLDLGFSGDEVMHLVQENNVTRDAACLELSVLRCSHS